ncbi:MAG: hypothetical protein JSC189_000178 [Candidatus Tokpelaia sp. JSC189]|nr:MAG: hypothetical protein JSC189_000178 [Candidatus Tokpelaia sp. JSC189]
MTKMREQLSILFLPSHTACIKKTAEISNFLKFLDLFLFILESAHYYHEVVRLLADATG